MDLYYNTAKFILRIYQKILSQIPQVSGNQPVLPGAKIIAANHPNVTDGFYLPFLFKEKLHFLIQGDLFTIPFIGWLLTRSQQIPVWPQTKYTAFRQAFKLLKKGETVVIFPEGRLNPNNQPVPAFSGAIKLSLLTGAPIIPIGFYVPTEYRRKIIREKNGNISQGFWQTCGRCYIQIGIPWFPGVELNGYPQKTAVSQLTCQLMNKIQALAGLPASA